MNTSTNDGNGTVTETQPADKQTRLKDEQRLASLESAIKKGWKQYLRLEGEIAEALQEIKTRKLYRYGYKNWEKYCQHVLQITRRSANRALNAHDVRKIEASIRQAHVDNEAVATKNGTRAPIFRELTAKERDGLEGLEGEAKTAKVQELMQSPAPSQTPIPKLPPPRIVLADTSGPEPGPAPAPEPQVQKPSCPLDNAQLHWVVLEIERCYVLNKAAWNKVPPPAPMKLVSEIQHQFQKWKM